MYRVASKENQVPVEFVSQSVSKTGKVHREADHVTYLDANQMTFAEIADLLNDYQLTRRGLAWKPISVGNLYRRWSATYTQLKLK